MLDEIDRALLPDEVAISSLTLAELTAGPHVTTSEARRAERQDRLQRLEASIESLDFDSACARAFGPIYLAARRLGGKPLRRRGVDLMIAATARAHQMPLYTLNASDLRGLDDLIEIVDLR